MRIPERLHIFWADDNTLEMDTDAGMQKRLFHFNGPKWQGGPLSAGRFRGALGETGAVRRERRLRRSQPGKGGDLEVVTTHVRPGYLE